MQLKLRNARKRNDTNSFNMSESTWKAGNFEVSRTERGTNECASHHILKEDNFFNSVNAYQYL